MPDLETLLAQKAELDRLVQEAEFSALLELVEAKEAYRADPTPETRARKAAAVEAIGALRRTLRAGRTAPQVGGDAFVSNPTTSEG